MRQHVNARQEGHFTQRAAKAYDARHKNCWSSARCIRSYFTLKVRKELS